MLSINFRNSLIIIFSFLLCFIFGKLIKISYLLSIDLSSRLILMSTLLFSSVIAISVNNKSPRIYPISLEYLKYKLYSYFTIIFFSIFWSYLATLMDAGFIDYTVDMMLALPLVIIILICYTLWVETKFDHPIDEYYVFGIYIARGDYRSIWQAKNFLRTILLKSQFLPFMYIVTLGGIERLLYIDNFFNINNFFSILYNFGIMFDVLIAFFGYFITSSILGNKILHVEDNFLGWFFCLICYPPFFYFLQNIYPIFEHPIPKNWMPYEYIFTYIILVFQSICWIIYWWSTLEFGFSFSNLTWRGLVSTGPYKYFRHPAYLFKNLYWWLSLIPYLCIVSYSQKLQLGLGLSIVSLIYYCRAKCEEYHLRRFPEYRLYYQKFN